MRRVFLPGMLVALTLGLTVEADGATPENLAREAGSGPTGLATVAAPRHDPVPSLAEVDAAAAAAPFSLTPRMKQWAWEVVPRDGSDLARLRRLTNALLDPLRFQLTELTEHTGTASEVFRSRRANCVGFSMLFVGMARELGIPVHFVLFDRAAGRSRRGDLLVSTAHIAAAHGSGDDVIVFDLGGARRPSPKKLRRLDDSAAAAIFYSNAGIELLLQGKATAAVEQLEIAVRLDPEMADAWSNLGVALRRTGHHGRARRAYKRAIDLSPDSSAPRRNLVLLSGAVEGE